MIREILKDDLDGLLRLYMQLHNNPMPEKTVELLQIWDNIFQDKNHHVIVAEENGEITDEKFRKRGLATQCRRLMSRTSCPSSTFRLSMSMCLISRRREDGRILPALRTL